MWDRGKRNSILPPRRRSGESRKNFRAAQQKTPALRPGAEELSRTAQAANCGSPRFGLVRGGRGAVSPADTNNLPGADALTDDDIETLSNLRKLERLTCTQAMRCTYYALRPSLGAFRPLKTIQVD
jgi:hypothetical protein